jgi:hypothetical protein
LEDVGLITHSASPVNWLADRRSTGQKVQFAVGCSAASITTTSTSPPRRLHLEAELFLERGEDRRTVKRSVVAAWGIWPLHLIRGQRQIDVEAADETGAIENHTLE